MSTIRDVADRAGVSISTVSRVLNDQADVSPKTRARVLEAVEALGYVPSLSGRALRGKSARLIGLITPEGYGKKIAENAVYGPGIHAVERALGERDFGSVLLPIGVGKREPCEAGKRALAPDAAMLDLADGFIFYCAWGTPPIYRYLRESGKPFLLVQRTERDESISTVRSDDEEGIRQAVYHLRDAGRRRIAYVAPPGVEGDCGGWRKAGYERACAELGLRYRRHVPIADWHAPLDDIVASFVKEERPDGIVAYNDQLAFRVIACLLRLGLQVPDDVAVIGYDDIDLAAALEPPLTTVRVPLGRLARYAVECLFSLLDDPASGPFHPVLPPTLVVRRSCGARGETTGAAAGRSTGESVPLLQRASRETG